MSEHTKGRLAVKGEWIIPEAHADRMIGSSTNKADDKSNYAHTVAIVRGKYQDDKANARRLAACWNAFDGVRTEFIEAMAGTGAMRAASDSMSALPAAQAELSAARALLREVYEEGNLDAGDQVSMELDNRIYSYLDACDKPGAPDAS